MFLCIKISRDQVQIARVKLLKNLTWPLRMSIGKQLGAPYDPGQAMITNNTRPGCKFPGPENTGPEG